MFKKGGLEELGENTAVYGEKVLIVTDENNQIELINYKAKNLLKLTKDNVIGNDINFLTNRIKDLNFLLKEKEVKDKLEALKAKIFYGTYSEQSEMK